MRVVAAEPAALAGALNRLLEDPAERTRLGAAARELARRKYTLLAMGRELKAWYEEVTHAAA